MNNPVNSGAVSGGASSGIPPPVSGPVAGVAPPVTSDNIPKLLHPKLLQKCDYLVLLTSIFYELLYLFSRYFLEFVKVLFICFWF